MFNNLSDKNKRKMLLNTFLYYPLALVIAISAAIAVLKFIGIMNDVPIGFLIMIVMLGIVVAIYHISQIYKTLLKENKGG